MPAWAPINAGTKPRDKCLHQWTRREAQMAKSKTLQIEGCVVQTLSRTLIEELKFNRSQVTSLDWESYPILKFPQVPEIVIDLIDRPTEKPWGAGEPSASVIPSAITNAVFDATGVRLRSIPYTPGKVKAAMQAS